MTEWVSNRQPQHRAVTDCGISPPEPRIWTPTAKSFPHRAKARAYWSRFPQTGWMNPPEPQPIRLLVVDDHKVVRLGLQTLLKRHAGIQVVGEAGTVAAAVSETARLQPGVVL